MGPETARIQPDAQTGPTVNKELQELARLARQQGWTVETATGSGHMKWTNPLGNSYNTSSTPSDPRSIANTKAALKKKGLITSRAELRRHRKDEHARCQVALAERTATGSDHDLIARYERDLVSAVETSALDDAPVLGGQLDEPVGPPSLEAELESNRTKATKTDTPSSNNPDQHELPARVSDSSLPKTPCPACTQKFTHKNNLPAHMRLKHPRWKQTRRGGEWLGPKAYKAWREGLDVEPVVVQTGTTRVRSTFTETHSADLSARTADNLLQACITAIWPEGSVPIKANVMLIAAQWIEDTEKFLRDLLDVEAGS